MAPITTTVRDIPGEVVVGTRNELGSESVVSCDNITTVPVSAIGRTLGLALDDLQEALARAISDAFDREGV